MNITERKISDKEINKLIRQWVTYFALQDYDAIIGVARGGMVPATRLAYTLYKPLYCISVKSYSENKEQENMELLQVPILTKETKRVLIVDDINDSGNTFRYIRNYFLNHFPNCACSFFSIFAKEGNNFPQATYGSKVPNDTWLVFPWEASV